ncbi:hypothetical protein [Membranihabitans marinus]|uniref:hypothetical protein n=1 Tax=Membranihabitans marinus TaxID=1227546 RepID=UPI001F194071|nr:hypothetical protein [Membranihabitans marinus]
MRLLLNITGCVLVLWMIMSACELKTSIPFDYPDFEAELHILATAGPISGGRVLIQYIRPLKGIDANYPPLPSFEVNLLEEGRKMTSFQEDSIGRFVIAPSDLSLKVGRGYSIEIINSESGVKFYSEESILPPKPIILEVNITAPEADPYLYFTKVTLAPVSQSVFGMSFYPLLMDESEIAIRPYSLKEQLNSKMQTLNDSLWTTDFEYVFRNRRDYGSSDSILYANKSKMFVTYLSEDLTRLIAEAEEQFYTGEFEYLSLNPVYNNMSNGLGLWGLFNEDTLSVEIK